jgi:hypothetical protein
MKLDDVKTEPKYFAYECWYEYGTYSNNVQEKYIDGVLQAFSLDDAKMQVRDRLTRRYTNRLYNLKVWEITPEQYKSFLQNDTF